MSKISAEGDFMVTAVCAELMILAVKNCHIQTMTSTKYCKLFVFCNFDYVNSSKRGQVSDKLSNLI